MTLPFWKNHIIINAIALEGNILQLVTILDHSELISELKINKQKFNDILLN